MFSSVYSCIYRRSAFSCLVAARIGCAFDALPPLPPLPALPALLDAARYCCCWLVRVWHHAVPNLSDKIRYQHTLVYARKPSGLTRPRADYSVGRVEVVNGGSYSHFDWQTAEYLSDGVEYSPITLDARCRAQLEAVSNSLIDRNIVWEEVPLPFPDCDALLGPQIATAELARCEPWVSCLAMRSGLLSPDGTEKVAARL